MSVNTRERLSFGCSNAHDGLNRFGFGRAHKSAIPKVHAILFDEIQLD
jgi:hypothetical protein